MAAAYPPWVILDEHCTLEVQGCSSSIADTNTRARCRTSTGHPIDVALCLAAPPEGSRVCVQLPRGIVASNAVVVAAHGDSMVVMVGGIVDPRRSQIGSTDHFVYSAGDAAAEPPRPPSLSLLPPHSITYEDEKRRPGCSFLDNKSTGLVCRGDGDFLVAELKMECVKDRDWDDNEQVHKEAALHLLRSGSGSGRWCVKRPVIVSGYGDAGEYVIDDLPSSWKNSMVIAVGDQMLCWVDLWRGLLFSDDVFDESPSRLRYVPFPAEGDFFGAHSVCVTADGRTVKVVSSILRCCCGGAAGESKGRGSHVHTWSLRMDVDMPSWVMDGSLDSNQLWDLDGYKGLPRVELGSPVVSMDEPDAICFVVCESHHVLHGDTTMWRIIVDMKNKTLRSVFRCPDEPEGQRRFTSNYDCYLPSTVSKYFNSKPSTTGQQPPPGPAAQAEAMQNYMMSSRIKNKQLQAIDDTMQAASPSPEAAILTSLQGIPSLDRDELLKAYRILTLTHDDSGRRFRSLMGLPMDLRKDWVLMEIKASEACVLCSACSADLQIKESAHKRRHQ